MNHSGDSDSTGAVAGNLIAAARGLSALPHEWVSAAEGHDELVQIADDLVLSFFYRDRSRLETRAIRSTLRRTELN